MRDAIIFSVASIALPQLAGFSLRIRRGAAVAALAVLLGSTSWGLWSLRYASIYEGESVNWLPVAGAVIVVVVASLLLVVTVVGRPVSRTCRFHVVTSALAIFAAALFVASWFASGASSV